MKKTMFEVFLIIQKGIWKGLASSVGKARHNEITFLVLFVHGKSKNVTLAKLKMISRIVKMLSNQKNKKKVKFMTGCFTASVSTWTCHFIENTKHIDQSSIEVNY